MSNNPEWKPHDVSELRSKILTVASGLRQLAKTQGEVDKAKIEAWKKQIKHDLGITPEMEKEAKANGGT